jgi:hypothetical protein
VVRLDLTARADLELQVRTCFTGTKVLAYRYKSTDTDTGGAQYLKNVSRVLQEGLKTLLQVQK